MEDGADGLLTTGPERVVTRGVANDIFTTIVVREPKVRTQCECKSGTRHRNECPMMALRSGVA